MTARVIRLALWSVAGLSILVFARLAMGRLFYPLELDCIEGVMLDHVTRLANGQPIYVEPSLRFIPLAYMPLLSFLASLLARVFSPGLWEPRLISLLAVAALCAIIARAVWLETRDLLLAVAAAALYLFSMGFTGNCHDVGRPDSLMLALAFGGLLTLRQTTGRCGAIAAGVLLAAAFLAKQHALWFALAASLYLLVNDRRRLPAFLAALAVAGAGAYALLSAWLGPWFVFYTWEIPHDWSQLSIARVRHYLGDGLFGALALMSAPALLALALPRRPWAGRPGLWAFALLGAAGSGLMATLDPSAYLHVMTPTVVALAIVGPVSLSALSRHLGGEARGAGYIPALFVLLQFVPLVYPVRTQRPHPRAVAAYTEFIRRLEALPGGVIMPYHGYYTSRAGKGTSMHIIPLDDILRARGNALLERDPEFLVRMFAPLREGPGRPAIVTDIPLERSGALWASIAPGYRLADSLGWVSPALVPLTGNRFTPTWIYLPVEPDSVPASPAPPA